MVQQLDVDSAFPLSCACAILPKEAVMTVNGQEQVALGGSQGEAQGETPHHSPGSAGTQGCSCVPTGVCIAEA